jgi:hypothetical protein
MMVATLNMTNSSCLAKSFLQITQNGKREESEGHTLGKSVNCTVKPSTDARYMSCCLGLTADMLGTAAAGTALLIASAVGDAPATHGKVRE